MYNIIVWGTGTEYNQYFNLLKYYEKIGEISIVGVTSDDVEIDNEIDGYRFYPKSCVCNLNFDYCLVAIKDFGSIKNEAVAIGISIHQLIPIRVLGVAHFSFKKYVKVKDGISILSRNCWGGICYNYLALEFRSPTINMYFSSKDFNKFVSKLNYYLSMPVEYVETGYDENLKRYYPIGRINDIYLHFNHYADFEAAVEAWERRKKRVDVKNMVIVSFASDYDDVMEFVRLPYEKKMIFIPKEIEIRDESCVPLNYKEVENGMTLGMYANGTANGRLSMIDPLAFLCGQNCKRN